MDVEVAPGVEIPAPGDEAVWVVGALVADPLGRVFVQRRSADRRLFPSCWDIVGGHVEPGETLLAALAREVHEETGWQLRSVDATVASFDWATPDGEARREVDYLVTVVGDLAAPRLERDKHPEYRWAGWEDLDVLGEGRPDGDTVIRDVVAEGLRLLR